MTTTIKMDDGKLRIETPSGILLINVEDGMTHTSLINVGEKHLGVGLYKNDATYIFISDVDKAIYRGV